MDTQRSTKATDPGPLAELQSHKVVVGVKQLKKALFAGQISQVFLAENADPALTQPLEALCIQYQIKCAWVSSMVDLGRACGIEVGAAAAAVVN